MLKTKNGNSQRSAAKQKNLKNKFKEKISIFLVLMLGLSLLALPACSPDDDAQESEPTLKVAFSCEVSGPDSLQVTCTNFSKLGDSAEGLTYAWDFGVDGDEDTSTETEPAYTYAAEDTYTITLTVTSADGMSVMGTQMIDLRGKTSPPALTVGFTCTPTGLTIICTNSSVLGDSTTQGLTYAWDFGVPSDTSDTSTDRAPTYTYTRAGSYTITLTVTSPDGMSMMMAATRVTVGAPNPNVAKLTGSTDGSDSSKKWILARADVALGIWPNGPNHPDPDNITSGAGAWWAFGTATPLHDRPCVLDDEYTFSIAGGVMKFAVDTMGTFFRDSDANGGHQAGGAEECVSETDTDIWNITRTAEAGETFPDSDGDSTPDIRDYRNKFSESDQGGYTFSLTGDDLTINGEGSYIGLVSKSNTGNGGYLVPDMRTFRILSFTEATDATSPDELIISMAANNGDGGYWVFRLLHYESGMLPAIPMPPPPLVLPVDFEAGTTVSFTGFSGGSGATVANPDATGNTSAMVAKITDDGSDTNAGAFFDLATPADFSTNCGLKMQVYGRAGLPVTLKIEGTGAPAQQLDQNVVADDTWETLSFDFSSVVTTADLMKYNRLVFFLDDTMAEAEELYIDDIAIDTDVGTCTIMPLTLPVGFEAGTTVSFTGFDGGSGATVENPDATGNNTSATVAKITDAGGNNNAGAFFDLRTPVDFSTNCGLKMQVYGRAGLPVTLKIEGTGASPQQLDQNVVAANTWETLSFDFSSVVTTADAMKYNRLIFFLDDDADAAEELHIDNIEIDTAVGACATSMMSAALPVTFEDDSTVPQGSGLFAFTGGGTATVDVVDNPNMTSGSGNESAKVLKQVESVGTDWWAGMGFFTQPFNTALAANCGIKMKVYGAEDLSIRFEIEAQSDPSDLGTVMGNKNLTQSIATGMGDQWHTMSFDFSSLLSASDATSTAYNKLVFRLDSVPDGPAATEEKILHIDDIEIDTDVGACSGTTMMEVALPVGFEAGTTVSFTGFSGGGGLVVANPNMTGNTSDMVAKITDDGGDNNAGAFFDLAAAADFSTNCGLKMQVYGRAALPVTLKIEGGGGAPARQITQNVGAADTWQTLSFDFSSVVSISNAMNYNRLVFFLDDTMAEAEELHIDDIAIDTDAGTCVMPLALPVGFESAPFPTFEAFEGANTAVRGANPSMTGINTSAMATLITDAGTSDWAGVKFQLDSPLDLRTNCGVKMKVYGTANLEVLFKLEGFSPTAEIRATTSATANTTWESLSFDLSAQIPPLRGNLYNTLVFFLGPGVSEMQTLHIDDIEVDTSVGACAQHVNVTIPATFETSTTLPGFEGFGGGSAEAVANPSSSGINTTAMVVKVTDNGSEIWTGVNLRMNTLDFSTNCGLKMKVYGETGLRVLAKLEGGSRSPIEVEQTTTMTDTWETLSYDFRTLLSAADSASAYNTVTLFLNNGEAAMKELHIDDIEIDTSVGACSGS